MTPRLWTRFLSFQEWKLTHPDLTDRDAILLYEAELKMFQNYQDELRNQTLNRQTQLTGDLLNLSADISTILTNASALASGRAHGRFYDYVAISGPPWGEGGVATHEETGVLVEGEVDSIHNFEVGDYFLWNLVTDTTPLSFSGIYKVTSRRPGYLVGNSTGAILFNMIKFTGHVNEGAFIKI